MSTTYMQKVAEVKAMDRAFALALVFEWVKTGVISKNQFIAIMTELGA